MAGLTPEGWVRKTYDEILADVEARQRADIDPGLDQSEFSLIGQLNRIFANSQAELWELGEQLYDMLDPDKVTGAQQDALYSMTNTLRQGPTKSTVTATVNLNAGTDIPAGNAVASVLGNPAARFVNAAPMVNAGGTAADFEVAFEAEETGPVFANDGTLTVIETPLAGWNSITNAAHADPGEDVESDADYRARRVLELAAPGGGSLIGIRADLLRVENVSAAHVLENTDSIVVDGMPPHSVEAIVNGGADLDIAQSLYGNVAAGIYTHGTEGPFEILDPDGNPRPMRFSRPTPLLVHIAIEVDTGDGYNEAVLKADIVEPSTDVTDPGFLNISTEVYAGRIVCTALESPGVLNARVGLSLTSISDPDAGVGKIEVGPRELAELSEGRIIVTVLP